MTFCYLDASAILQYVLQQPERLDLARVADGVIASELAWVECRRVFDRLRLHGKADARGLERRRESLEEYCAGVSWQAVEARVLPRAAEPLELVVGTLDAIHLATALRWREAHEQELAFATHDRGLARGARQYGFRVLGTEP